ncbi:MAG: uroporphyrinogen-III synthase [Cohaesibacter sp.]|jgi:uroporphyrinogen-III synthase|nr:uroporphyrinogen-III synthase [Cohaesibacter sp.]
MRLLVTRPSEDQDQTCQALAEMGIEPVSAPVMSVAFQPLVLPQKAWQGVIFTSRNGLRSLDKAQLSSLLDVPVFCVGRKTAQLAKELGFETISRVQPQASGFADCLAGELSPDAGPLLYITGLHRSGQIDIDLRKRGFEVTLLEAYETKPIARFSDDVRRAIQDGFIHGVLLYSARTAQLFLNLLERDNLTQKAADLTFYCLSQAVAAPIGEKNYPLVVANAPNEASLLACAENGHNYLR